MKPLYLVAASALALTAAACGPKVPAARAALDCPMKQGDLTRTMATSDGKTCMYATPDGAEVTLQLVSTAGGVDNALANIETTLLANRTAPVATEGAKDAASGKASKETADAAAKAADEAARDAGGAGVEVRAGSGGSGVDLKVDGKDVDAVNVSVRGGKAVVTESEDGTTRVSLPGIHIVANDANDTAKVQVGPIKIDAGGDGATIRMRRDVRLRGEQLNPEKRGVRATFLYTGHDLPDGYRYVGYEAGGPKRGPITVAVVKSRAERHDGDEIYKDVKRLVRKNGGV
ncbi:hypothetical protein [Phenylobacterium sp.]|uniref:hypothetical protein n=1 Tax=Phenylobacterium sp. TaxID=1871053 RepID=UPI0025E37385|nr:hypothetical protein [Phenylobacterium sp.]MBX3486244.1 hypothetical protein [Phenylobacterium sp.]MCW5759305.1 hypothetical protein [Phenylobacterium sp.]